MGVEEGTRGEQKARGYREAAGKKIFDLRATCDMVGHLRSVSTLSFYSRSCHQGMGESSRSNDPRGVSDKSSGRHVHTQPLNAVGK